MKLLIISDCLSRGFHLRGKISIHTIQFCKGKSRYFHIPSPFFFRIDYSNSLFFQAFAKNNLCCNISQWISCCLWQKRNCSWRTWIHLNNRYIFLFVHNKLNIKQSDNTNSDTQFFRIVQNSILYFIRNTKHRIYTNRITGMNPCPFYQLHDSRNKYVCTIANSIDFNFFSNDIFIY